MKFDFESDINKFRKLNACNNYFKLITKILCSSYDSQKFILIGGIDEFKSVIDDCDNGYIDLHESLYDLYVDMGNLYNELSGITVSKGISQYAILDDSKVILDSTNIKDEDKTDLVSWVKTISSDELVCAKPYISKLESGVKKTVLKKALCK